MSTKLQKEKTVATGILQTREHVLKDFPDKIQNINGDPLKLYTGDLSPGCKICIEGMWACIFLNHLCTRRCFFCPQDRNLYKDHKPGLDGINFDRVEDCLDYLETFKFKGVGFTGGEPLLSFDLLLSYITGIKQRFGSRMYVWIYTNGDLIDKTKLEALKKAGLDEIRFDLSARKYDFTPIKLAKKIFGNVTIETPVVPEEEHALKQSIEVMHTLHISRLNLHELMMTKFNRAAFEKRGYSVRNETVAESTQSLFNTLGYALRKKIPVGINICTKDYKTRYQGLGLNKRYSPFSMEYFESITRTGFIRQIYIKPANRLLKDIIKGSNSKSYYWDKETTRLYMNPDLLLKISAVLPKNTKLFITYFYSQIKNIRSKIPKGTKVLPLNQNFSIMITRKKLKGLIISNEIYYWVYLYGILRGLPVMDVIKNIIKHTGSSIQLSAGSLKKLSKEISSCLKLFDGLEFSRKVEYSNFSGLRSKYV